MPTLRQSMVQHFNLLKSNWLRKSAKETYTLHAMTQAGGANKQRPGRKSKTCTTRIFRREQGGFPAARAQLESDVVRQWS